MSTTYYECDYNTTTQTEKYYKEIDSELLTKDVITGWKSDTDLYWKYYLRALGIDATSMGKPWKVYCAITKDTISLDTASGSIAVGETLQITGTVLPLTTDITWSSADESIATVADGLVTGIAAGTVKITGATVNGQTATCTVTVTE